MVSLRRRSNDVPTPQEDAWTAEGSAGFDLLPGHPLPAWALPPAPEPEPEPPLAERAEAPVGVFLVTVGAPAEGFAGVSSEVSAAPPLSPPPTPLFLPPPPPPGAVAFHQTPTILPTYGPESFVQSTIAPAPPAGAPAYAAPPIAPPIAPTTWVLDEPETVAIADDTGVSDYTALVEDNPAVDQISSLTELTAEAPVWAPPTVPPPGLETYGVETYAVPSAIPGVNFSATPFAPIAPIAPVDGVAFAEPEMSPLPHVTGQFEPGGTGMPVYAPPPVIAPAPAMTAATLYDVLPEEEATETHRHHGAKTHGKRFSVSRKAIALIAIVVALLLAAAYVIPNYVLSGDDATTSVAPNASSAITTPTTAAGLTRIDGTAYAKWAQATQASLTAQGIATPFAATYGTGGLPKAQIWGGVPATTQPVAEITKAFSSFQRATASTITRITTVKIAGSGVMQCGTGIVRTRPSTLCFWTDPTSFGGVIVLGTTPAQTATALLLRSTVEST